MAHPHTLDLEMLARQAASVRSLARALVHDELEAEELAQESLVAALERPPRNMESLQAWLATVVRRLVLDRRRSESRRRTREALVAREESQESHAIALERLELEQRVLEEVLALREPYRTAVYLRFWEDLEPSAIAEKLDAPVKTVQSRLARALEELRRRLDARSGGDRGVWLPGLAAIARSGSAAGPSSGVVAAGLAAGAWSMKQAVAIVLVLAIAWIAWRGVRAIGDGGAGTDLRKDVVTLDAATPPAEAIARPLEETNDPPKRELAARVGAPATSASLRVHLSYHDGRPAVGVSIDVQCASDPAPRDEFLRRRTDESGHAMFTDVWPGKVSLFTDRGGRFQVEVPNGESREVEFTMPAGISVEGQVVSESGEAASDAEIWIDGQRRQSPRAHFFGRTDAQGRFRVEALDPQARVGARAPGRCPSLEFEVSTLPSAASGAREVTLRLGPKGGDVEGRVVDPENRPVGGAIVKIGERGGGVIDLPDGSRGVQAEPVPAETDSEGRFRYPGGLRSEYQPVTVSARGWPHWKGNVGVRVGETSHIDVRLVVPASVEGRVVDRDGTPVEGASVLASKETGGGWHYDPLPAPRATTDADGRFHLAWLHDGVQELNASVHERPELGRASLQVECTAGNTSAAELRLDPGLTISGRVVTRDGAPLGNWSVHGEPQPQGQVYPRQSKTDEQGRFVLSNLDKDSTYRLRVNAPHELTATRAEKGDVPPGAADVEIVVENTDPLDSRVRGRVQEVDGRIPVDLQLIYSAQGDNRGYFIEYDKDSGHFESEPMRAGRYRLSLMRGGMTVLRTEPFDLRRQETKDLGTLVPEGAGRLELVLKGLPAEIEGRAQVFLNRPGHSTEELKYDSGVYLSRWIASGEWRVELSSSSLLLRKSLVTIRPDETQRVELATEIGVRVDLVCTFADPDAAWAMLTLKATEKGGDVIEAGNTWYRSAVQSGQLRLHGLALPAGTWTIDVSTDTGLTGRREIEVAPGVDRDSGEIVVK